ncbi:hypothetical protein OHA37_28170 [Streptomyces sp. NBC_00335]|uniref:hypothetical protein n=1 Tax=unclassified Streptomyces TaxID=2593676 RepID=UPI0022576C4D|nr:MULTISPECIES: hypothetical protein [unclassified Streptomyces]MCX5407729.1 hypothetical protein [Streptomyces sp. NBC_00086]
MSTTARLIATAGLALVASVAGFGALAQQAGHPAGHPDHVNVAGLAWDSAGARDASAPAPRH